MMSEKPEPSTQDLVESANATRALVAEDVERLASALTPAQLKTRAKHAAEGTAAHLLRRARLQLARAPRVLASYVVQHPIVGFTIFVGAAAATWRLALGRRR
jgi:hypothetical protein